MHKKIIFRCDAGEIPETGTGHLYRSLVISKFLKKKFNLKKKDILFISKTKGKYKLSNNILKKNNIDFYPIKNQISDYSENEINELNDLSSDLLIIDRWGNIKKQNIMKLRKKHKKIILIDDGSNYRNLADLSLNPLKILKKKGDKNYVGYKYNILPSLIKKHKTEPNSSKTIFLFFGGYDHKKLMLKILKNLKKINLRFKILISEKYKQVIKKENGMKVEFYKNKDHYKNLIKSEITITSGGLAMFDSIFFNKFTICFPQYKHQAKNINILCKKKVITKMNLDNLHKLNDIIFFYYKNKREKKIIQKKQKKIINSKLMLRTLNLIYKCYEK